MRIVGSEFAKLGGWMRRTMFSPPDGYISRKRFIQDALFFGACFAVGSLLFGKSLTTAIPGGIAVGSVMSIVWWLLGGARSVR